MKIGYADPPYPSQAKKLYGCAEIDHKILINSLDHHYPEGWALSTASSAIKEVLALCPSDVRVAAWVKPFCSFKPNVNPAYAWEPIIWKGGRSRARKDDTVRDWVASNITLEKGTIGAKPLAFWFWLFELFNLQGGDQFDDLFPGSYGGSKAYEKWLNLKGQTLEKFFIDNAFY
jgi:hypothetical protein